MALFRRRELWIPQQIGQSTARTSGANLALRPFQNVNTTNLSLPSWVRNVEVPSLMLAYTTNPIANTFQFSFLPYRTAANEAFGVPFGSEVVASCTGTQNYNNGSTNYRYYFTSTYAYSFPDTVVADAQTSGFYNIIISLKQLSGGSLTTTNDNWFGGMVLAY
jgi:hypothetical protein